MNLASRFFGAEDLRSLSFELYATFELYIPIQFSWQSVLREHKIVYLVICSSLGLLLFAQEILEQKTKFDEECYVF